MKTVTIAIPSLHRPELTARCLTFLQKQTLSLTEWDIVIIENEARPGSILADPLPPGVRRIELPTNEGTTGSINRAVESSESRFVLLLNNDVELKPDYLQKLIQALDEDQSLGFAAGKLLRATQRTHFDGAGDAMLLGGASYRLGHFDEDSGQFDERRSILSGCGAAVLYRRDVFDACGRLDEQFFAYLDDLDLALRSQLLGYGGMYVPDAIAYHVGSATLGEKLDARRVELLTRNQIFLLMKDYPAALLMRLLPRIAAYEVLWFAYVLQSGFVAAYLRGLFAALRGMPAMLRKRRALIAERRISNQEFLARLRQSEQQIHAWHRSQPAEKRSLLLNLYFGIFGAR